MEERRWSGSPIQPISCLFLSVVRKNLGKGTVPVPDRTQELRVELAQKIAQFIGSAGSLPPDIPRVTFYQYIAPTDPASVVYEPSVAVVAQGRKRLPPLPREQYPAPFASLQRASAISAQQRFPYNSNRRKSLLH
jgi:hypothetical protein